MVLEPVCRNQRLCLTPTQQLYSGGHNLPITFVFLYFLSTGYMKPGAHVKPGETFTYKWRVPENGGPSESDPPCLTYLYYSATDAVKDTNSGLVGPLLVCRKNSLNEDGMQVHKVENGFSETAGWWAVGRMDLHCSQLKFKSLKKCRSSG